MHVQYNKLPVIIVSYIADLLSDYIASYLTNLSIQYCLYVAAIL